MLTTGRRFLLSVVITTLLTLGGTTIAYANGEFWVDGDGDTGSIGITNPGTENSSGGNDVENITDIEFTPGPTTCTLNKGTHIHGDIHSKTNDKDKTVTKSGENCLK